MRSQWSVDEPGSPAWEDAEDARQVARERGLAAGAVRRGEAWDIGTLVRWKGKNSKVTYRITGIRASAGHLDADHGFDVECTPLQPGPGRSVFWTSIEYLRKVDA